MKKLLVCFQISNTQINIQLIKSRGDDVLEITVFGESKIHRITRLNPHDVDVSDVKTYLSGRGDTRLFKAVDKNGEPSMVFVVLNGTNRVFYLINTPYEILRKSLNTSMNEYPQGKFLFNLEKTKKLPRSISELYQLESPTKQFREEVWTNSLLDLMANVQPTKLTKIFPMLNNAIPKKQHKGLFFTETQVYWMERTLDQLYCLTDKFYGSSETTRSITVAPTSTNVVTVKNAIPPMATNVELPHYDKLKCWISPAQPAGRIKNLLDRVEEYESHGPIRIILQVKTTRKTSGRYQVMNMGTFGREIITNEMVNSLKNRMNGHSTLVMNGDGFTLLYTLTDVNALYFRRKGEDLQPTQKVVVEAEPVAVTQPEQQPEQLSMVDLSESTELEKEKEIEDPVPNAKPYIGPEISIDPFMMDTLFASKTPTKKVKKPMNDQTPKEEAPVVVAATYEQGTTPYFGNPFPEQEAAIAYDDDFDYIFKTPVITSIRNVFFKVQPLSLHRLALIELPSPYSNYIPWEDVTHHNVIDRFGINNGEMIGFGAATFYRHGDNVYKTDTLIRLDTVTEVVPTKTPLQNLNEALAALSKDMPLLDMINLVTDHYSLK